MSPPRHDVFTWQGKTMVDRDGEELGTVAEIYLDQETGQPEWARIIATERSVLVPLLGAKPAGDVIQAGYERAVVRNAPAIAAGLERSDAAEKALSRHYCLPFSDARSHTGLRQPPPRPADREGPTRG